MTNKMQKKETTELVDVDSIDTTQFEGMINVRKELLKVPRVKLTQGNSAELGSGLANIGEFSCYTRAKNFGKELTIIPLTISESATYFAEDMKTILCKSNDLITGTDEVKCKECPFGKEKAFWYFLEKDCKKEEKEKCYSSIDLTFACVENNEIDEIPLILSFSKSNYKIGQDLLNNLYYHPKQIPFLYKYFLYSEKAPNAQFNYFVIKKKPERLVLNKDEMNKIMKIALTVNKANKEGRLEKEENLTDIPM